MPNIFTGKMHGRTLKELSPSSKVGSKLYTGPASFSQKVRGCQGCKIKQSGLVRRGPGRLMA